MRSAPDFHGAPHLRRQRSSGDTQAPPLALKRGEEISPSPAMPRIFFPLRSAAPRPRSSHTHPAEQQGRPLGPAGGTSLPGPQNFTVAIRRSLQRRVAGAAAARPRTRARRKAEPQASGAQHPEEPGVSGLERGGEPVLGDPEVDEEAGPIGPVRRRKSHGSRGGDADRRSATRTWAAVCTELLPRRLTARPRPWEARPCRGRVLRRWSASPRVARA